MKMFERKTEMLYYIGLYSQQQNTQNRNSVLAAVNKMNYIIGVIKKNSYEETIVSCCTTKDKKGYSGEFVELYKNVFLKTFYTFGRKNVLTKAADCAFMKLQLLFYLLKSLKKDDILLVYHSPYYCNLIRKIKRIKKIRLILEVEELYSDVNGDKPLKKRELAVCNSADAFLFPTKLLSDAVNPKNKPYALIHGTYEVEAERKKIFNDGKIHVVYAGTFDPRKGGASAAVSAAEYLPENYHIHILGFGSDIQTENIRAIISETAEKSKAEVTYDGLLAGEEYISFIQSCDIGLSTQNPDADFNDTSFPSKILSYMANGLRVVSIRIPAIEESAIGEYMVYYDKQTPQNIARAIMNIDFNDRYNGKEVISVLNKKFFTDIGALIKDIGYVN